LGFSPESSKRTTPKKSAKAAMYRQLSTIKVKRPFAVSVNELELNKLVHTAESHIIDLRFPDGKVKRSFIKAVQFHPVTDRIIHTDFQLFAADEVIEMDVPVSVTGESVGVDKGGKLQILRHNPTILSST